MHDPYETLGVPRDADATAIRKAYRNLAKKHHPDLNPGDALAVERFQALAAANEILSDPEKRGVGAHGGRPAGDLYATPRVVLGPSDAALAAFLWDRKPEHPGYPRDAMERVP